MCGPYKIKTALFDFGGVIAEEGFRNGLIYIAQKNNIDEAQLFETTQQLILSSGYLTGLSTEADFWHKFRNATGIKGSDEELKVIFFERFIIRDWMIELVKKLRDASVQVAILSDQTNWLDELDAKLHFFNVFDRVFNSFHIGKSKIDKSLFEDVIGILGINPNEAIFVDDTLGHIERARSIGIHAIHYQDKDQFLSNIQAYFPGMIELNR